MHIKSDWRSPIAHAHYGNHDMADFAQEFLRRNPDYQWDYADTIARIAQGHLNEKDEMEVLARRWGMIFPLCSRCHSERRTCALGT
jgi:Family of unknown function (DUF6499)